MRKLLVPLKPDKGNGVVLIDSMDYVDFFSQMFNDESKFMKLDKDPTLERLNSLHPYLRKLLKPGELTHKCYKEM